MSGPAAQTKRAIHVFLLPVYPVLFLYAHNIGQLSLRMLAIPLAVVAVCAALCYLSLRITLKDTLKAAALTSVIFVLFFSFGHLRQLAVVFCGLLSRAGITLEPQALLYAGWLIVLLYAIRAITRPGRDLKVFTHFLNVTALVLAAYSLAAILWYEVNRLNVPGSVAKDRGHETRQGEGALKEQLPNIYFILMDAYGGNEILRDVYGYDNKDFLAFLAGKGFYVAGKSHSNYMRTGPSVTATLNMDYLDALVQRLGPDYDNVAPIKNMAEENKLFSFLRERGYTIVVFSSGQIETEIRNADVCLAHNWTADEFQNELLSATPLPVILGLFGAEDQFEARRKRILYIFDRLPYAADGRSPAFVFAHIFAPHPPFVFGPDGQRVKADPVFRNLDGDQLITEGGLSREAYREHYVGQLIFMNKELKKAISAILARSKRPPVIILQSDHGPRSMLFWDSPENTDCAECTSMLNAIYMPGVDSSVLYDSISPVNTFRVVLDSYFGAGYGLLEDRSYFSNDRHPYRFIDITDRIRR
ncbi:MAG: hypothetical protein JW919_03350 [Candidatus Omnitrophica bacterium]|nr:hypothetical protein [Candidatus Omnitrophota bacterium]